jgi:hypothetical protein
MKTKNMKTLSIRNLISRPPSRRGLPRKQQLPRTQTTWIIRGFLLLPLALALAWFALSPTARAVTPAPDGGYPGGNTAEGDDALFSLTTGLDNTAVGNDALYSLTTGISNTAIGDGALYSNTTGGLNTANGVDTLAFNTTGGLNTANGHQALHLNTTGNANTASGTFALSGNTTGYGNTATGYSALENNTTGLQNTANGEYALLNNTGSNNIALGFEAGLNRTTGSNNIDIGNAGSAGKSNIIRIGTNGTQKNAYIAGISGVTVAGGVGVIIDSNGHLGTAVSSARFKDEVRPMDKASEAILALQPVTFRYKHELDPDGIPQFGLVAEQVEKVNPDLVARDDQGKAYTVRYEAVNAMLLNEFLKEHRKVEEQGRKAQEQSSQMTKQDRKVQELEATVTQLQSALKDQAALIQKVSDKVEMSKPAPQMVASNR